MFPAVQPDQQIIDAALRRADGEVPQVPDGIVRADLLVPAGDQELVHLAGRGERPAIHEDDTVIAEMGVAGEEDRHERTGLRTRRSTTSGSSAWPTGLNGLPTRPRSAHGGAEHGGPARFARSC